MDTTSSRRISATGAQQASTAAEAFHLRGPRSSVGSVGRASKSVVENAEFFSQHASLALHVSPSSALTCSSLVSKSIACFCSAFAQAGGVAGGATTRRDQQAVRQELGSRLRLLLEQVKHSGKAASAPCDRLHCHRQVC